MEIPLWRHSADSNERKSQIARFLAKVSLEYTKALPADRKRLMKGKLGRKSATCRKSGNRRDHQVFLAVRASQDPRSLHHTGQEMTGPLPPQVALALPWKACSRGYVRSAAKAGSQDGGIPLRHSDATSTKGRMPVF